MDQVIPFYFSSNQIRVLVNDGDAYWFIAKEVCDCLGIVNSRDACTRLDDDDVALTDVIDALGRSQQMTIINEPGLYNLILRSDKPEAKIFKRWITHEVLPALRKTGNYSTQRPGSLDAKKLGQVSKAFLDGTRLAGAAGLSGGARILAANALARDATGLSPLQLLGIDESRYVTPSPDLTAADAFFAGICDLPAEAKKKFVELYLGVLRIRVPAVIEAINLSGGRLDKLETMRALKSHPAYLGSNRQVRAYFGEAYSASCKAWEFNPDLLYHE